MKEHKPSSLHSLTSSQLQSIQVPRQYLQLLSASTNIQKLRKQSSQLTQQFQQFKQNTIMSLNKAMGKLTSLIYRQFANKHKIQEQLNAQLTKNMQMKKQVMQLRQMIQQFVSNQYREVQAKNQEVMKLKAKVQYYEKNFGVIDDIDNEHQSIIYNQECSQEQREESENVEEISRPLEVIQEVSEYTGSFINTPTVSTLRGSSFPLISTDQNTSNQPNKFFDNSRQSFNEHIDNKNKQFLKNQQQESQQNGKKAKKFINFFRQKVDEANQQSIQQITATNNLLSSCSSIDNLHLGDTDKININKSIQSPRKMQFLKKNTLFAHNNHSHNSSLYSSNENLIMPSSEQNSKNNKSRRCHSKQQNKENNVSCVDMAVMMTPTSKANKLNNSKANNLYQQKLYNSNKSHRIGLSSRSNFINCVVAQNRNHQRQKSLDYKENSNQGISSEQRVCRTHSRTNSKQKIKITSKILQQENMNYPSKMNAPQNGTQSNKKPLKLRPSVHLGSKNHLKKLARDVRTSLQQLKIWQGQKCKQVKYNGQRKNNMRWGKGTLLYDNGIQYQGTFVQNYRHGTGKITINGIQIYEGQCSLNQLSGHGYIKSLKNISEKCPKLLHQASYCGQLLQNKLHGMGTLFINQNEKFVSKFIHGVPVGQFTYYNHSDIEFGNWF